MRVPRQTVSRLAHDGLAGISRRTLIAIGASPWCEMWKEDVLMSVRVKPEYATYRDVSDDILENKLEGSPEAVSWFLPRDLQKKNKLVQHFANALTDLPSTEVPYVEYLYMF